MTTHLEQIIQETGGCGRYQIFLCLIINASKLYLVFGMLFMIIGAKVPNWWCVDDYSNETIAQTVMMENSSGYQTCINHNGSSCRNFIFDETTSSIVPEWNLVCENDWITATMLSVQMAGVFVGNFIGGHVADLVGRKPTYYVTMGVTTLSMIITVLSNSWLMFAILRFFIGLSIGFQMTAKYNIQTEFVLPRWRTWVVGVPSWAVATIVFALISWGLQDWRLIHVVGAAFGVASLTACWFVQESFRWKVAHDRVDEAKNIVKFVAKVNRAPVPNTNALDEVAASVRRSEKGGDRIYSILDLVKSQTLRTISFLLTFRWITVGLGTYGIQFGLQALSGNIYINLCVVEVINIPLQVGVIFLQNRYGRKKTSVLLFAIFTVFAAAVGMIDQLEESVLSKDATRACVLVALIAISASWTPVQTHTMELYPTVVRNIGYGVQNTMARVGAIIGPQLVLLDAKLPGAMYFVCAALGFITILTILPLPETNNEDLQDTLPDIETQLSLEVNPTDTEI